MNPNFAEKSPQTSPNNSPMVIWGDIIDSLQENQNYAIYLVGMESLPLYIRITSLGASSFETYIDGRRQTRGFQFVTYILIAPISDIFQARYTELRGRQFPQEGMIAKFDEFKEGWATEEIDDDPKDVNEPLHLENRKQEWVINYLVGVYHIGDKELKNNLWFLHSANLTNAHDVLRRIPQVVKSIHF